MIIKNLVLVIHHCYNNIQENYALTSLNLVLLVKNCIICELDPLALDRAISIVGVLEGDLLLGAVLAAEAQAARCHYYAL